MIEQSHNGRPFGSSDSGPGVEVYRSVYIVDDDPAVCDAIALVLRSKGYTVKSFDSARYLLAAVTEKTTGVLILDLFMASMSGLELQAELRNRGIDLKTIFISGYADIEKAVQAIKGGAIDFIEKPYSNKQLLKSVEEAMLLVSTDENKRRQQDTLGKCYERLTAREREIMKFLVRGDSNRQLAHRLGLSSRTVEIHRSKIMHKLEVASLPDLVRMMYASSDFQPEEILMNIRQSPHFGEDQNG